MGVRYTAGELLQLRESPLIVKPAGLPPTEEWMGPPQEHARNQAKTSHQDRGRNHDSTAGVDETNKRPGLDRHISRSSANPEDIILGPPKTSFASANPLRNAARSFDLTEKPPLPRDPDSRDRFNFRRGQEVENDRRDMRNTMRAKRSEGEQDGEGWSTVKPRKSFGTESAERFTGRMGGDRHREDRRFRDREDRDRPARGFDTFSRDKEPDPEQDGFARRNGLGRGRNEPSWFKDNQDVPSTPGDRKSNGDKFADRSRGWREKDKSEKLDRDKGDDRGVDRKDRGHERGMERGDRRWDRDARQERDPEWMDEPADERKQAHTQEDFQKWKERMKASNGNTSAEEDVPRVDIPDVAGQNVFFGLEKPKAEIPLTPLLMDTGPDKFFGMWAAKQDIGTESVITSKKEGKSQVNTGGRASRFTSFFTTPQEDSQRRQTEPIPPVPKLPTQENTREKEEFQKLLQKLQSQSFGLSSPSTSANPALQATPLSLQEKSLNGSIATQESLQQYRPERQEPSRSSNRGSQQHLQDLLNQRQSAGSSASSRPEQVLQDLVNQRQNALSQASSRTDPPPNRNAEFLMGLMQNARAAPEPLRSEQLMMRMPAAPQQPDRQMQQLADREQELQREQRERSASQRLRRPEAPPGFYDDGAFQRGPQPQHDSNARAAQPTQILQRPPPGLDQQPPPGWAANNSQLPPPMAQQRHIPPPPGLAGGPARGMPIHQGMFPPGFPGMGSFPPPDGMVGAPRNIPPPPPGFMMPPPGFMGGPPVGAFPGPDSLAYGPFDGRGAPPLGNFRRS
ncbi:MAG: hypothetical protein M1818_001241 [Claussenomyces sp. TS43310]|nr:MAG: hypothetical protein M1818_001241 [Claussenomyces sp. TS43310]